jgi:hypothetical protein
VPEAASSSFSSLFAAFLRAHIRSGSPMSSTATRRRVLPTTSRGRTLLWPMEPCPGPRRGPSLRFARDQFEQQLVQLRIIRVWSSPSERADRPSPAAPRAARWRAPGRRPAIQVPTSATEVGVPEPLRRLFRQLRSSSPRHGDESVEAGDVTPDVMFCSWFLTATTEHWRAGRRVWHRGSRRTRDRRGSSRTACRSPPGLCSLCPWRLVEMD